MQSSSLKISAHGPSLPPSFSIIGSRLFSVAMQPIHDTNEKEAKQEEKNLDLITTPQAKEKIYRFLLMNFLLFIRQTSFTCSVSQVSGHFRDGSQNSPSPFQNGRR
jgi:hypothetical protein